MRVRENSNLGDLCAQDSSVLGAGCCLGASPCAIDFEVDSLVATEWRRWRKRDDNRPPIGREWKGPKIGAACPNLDESRPDSRRLDPNRNVDRRDVRRDEQARILACCAKSS